MMLSFQLISFFFFLSVWNTHDTMATLPGEHPAEKASETVKNEWIWLFDGSHTDHWMGVKSDRFPQHGWTVENKALVVNKDGKADARGGDIITREKYGNFDLAFEFKLTAGANSGLKYLVSIYPDDGAVLGCEYQMIDDEGNKDVANDPDGKRLTASLYELFEASSDKEMKPTGTWNTGRILVNGPHVEHWLNGKKVVEYERGNQAFLEARAKSKFKDVADFGLVEEGYILLQDHGDEAAFRNIRIKKL